MTPLKSFLHFSYASLFFLCAVEQSDNELCSLELIHRYVELLDKYFGSVDSYCSRMCSRTNV